MGEGGAQVTNMESAIKMLERREKALDRLFVGVFLVALPTIFSSFFMAGDPADGIVVNAAVALVMSLFAGYPVALILGALDGAIRRRWATSYVIEEGDGVLKVFGAVPVLDWGHVRARLLSMRPGYKTVDDAYERFGCTMAAIPASAAELRAREELSAMGLEV